MIEKIILDYLGTKLDVPVYMERQKTEPKKFVIIEKTGSSRTNMIDSSTVAIQSYATTLYQAAALNEAVKDAMEDIVEEDAIVKVSLNSDYNYTDTTEKIYRYQAVFDLVHY